MLIHGVEKKTLPSRSEAALVLERLSPEERILYLAGKGDVEGVRLAVEKGVSINTINEHGETVLSMGLRAHTDAIVDYCLSHGFLPAAEFRGVNGGGLAADVALYLACRDGRADIVKKLLALGALPNGNGHGPENPLANAILGRHHDIIRLLIARGADTNGLFFFVLPEAPNLAQLEPLIWAPLHTRDQATMEVLLDAGVVWKDLETRSPLLMEAVSSNWEEGVELLLRTGVDPEIPDLAGETPFDKPLTNTLRALLRSAVASRDFLNASGELSARAEAAKLVRFFGRKQLTPAATAALTNLTLPVLRARDLHQRTLLFHAIEIGPIEVVRLLVEQGAQLNLLDEDGWSPTALAVKMNRLPVVEYLVEKGADPNLTGPQAMTPLAAAIESNNSSAIDWLLAHGARGGTEQKSKITPLTLALEHGDGALTARLLDAGARPNEIDREGWPAIFHAALGLDPALVQVLEKRGASLEREVKKASPLLTLAVKLQDLPKANGLLLLGVSEPEGIVAQAAEQPEMVTLLKEFAQKNGRERAFETSFWTQLNAHTSAEVAAFLAADGNPDFPGRRTPLQLAVSLGRADLVATLLERGANPNGSGFNDDTPLVFQAIQPKIPGTEEDKAKLVRLLLKSGARLDLGRPPSPDLPDEFDGETALMNSIRRGAFATTRLLLDLGANPWMQDQRGRDAMRYLEKFSGGSPAEFQTVTSWLKDAQKTKSKPEPRKKRISPSF